MGKRAAKVALCAGGSIADISTGMPQSVNICAGPPVGGMRCMAAVDAGMTADAVYAYP
jgi:hypothetical protein